MPPQPSVTASQPPSLVAAAGHGDGAVGRGVPDRVAQQVRHHPGQLRLAAEHGRPALLGRDQPDPLGRRDRCGRGDRVGDHVAQRHRGQREPQRAGVDPGQLEQIVHQGRPSGRSRPGSGGGSRRPSPRRSPPRPPAPRPSPAGRPAGVRRSCETQATSSRRLASICRSRTRISSAHIASAGQPPAQPEPLGDAHRAGQRQHDEQHPHVVLGDEHALGHREDAGQQRPAR